MKINKDGLHPLYDQYSNDENRLTHALLHTIGSSKWIFSRFLKKFVGIDISLAGRSYEISTQKVPFSQGDNDPAQIESIPDAWIVDNASALGIAVEVKDREDNLSLSQLRHHADRVRHYKHPYLLVITPDFQQPKKIVELEYKERGKLNIVWRSWDQVYRWLVNLQVRKSSNRKQEDFLIKSMKEYLERRREVLGFQGIFYQTAFNVSEAKAILNAEMQELEGTVKNLYKGIGKRRPAITTLSQESVWDCFGRKEGFTSDLHVTVILKEEWQDIGLTVPNRAMKAWPRLRKIFSDQKEERKLFSILYNLRKEAPNIFIEFNQRHYRAQRFAVRDGYMEFNIDTLGTPFNKKKTSEVKEFPVWLPVIRDAIINKKKINGQVMFKTRFFIKETRGIDKPHFILTAKHAIKAFKPLYDFLKKSV